MSINKQRIVIFYFHPTHHRSRVNKLLLNGISDLEGITVRNMYDIYPDFYINVKKEQDILLENDLIIWQHPFYWYSSPSLLKEWIDLVLQHGFAYGRKGTALKGKMVMNAITSGGRREVYREGGPRRFTVPQLLAPFHQTVEICYMEYLPPFVVHGTHLLDTEGLRQAAENYRRLLISLRDSAFSLEDMQKQQYINDLLT